jgi:DNA-binding CsgD family transcriptional regulator/tetratricopeptide (TPR) repeat protein
MTALPGRALICPTLISRTHERAVLRSLMDAAKGEQGCVALISGEAGIGKSRLVAEAKAQASAQGFLLLQGSCFQADSSYPYAPLLDLLSAFLAGRSSLPLVAEQEPLLSELAGLLPDLALLLPEHLSSPQLNTLQPTEQKHRLWSVLTQLFISQAAMHPVLVIVEDLHWCDESSLDFLLSLGRHARSHPLVCLFTYRSDEPSPGLRHWLAQLDRERLAQEISLAPLSRSDVGAMLQAIFAAPQPVPAELLDPIYTLSEGNPFFVEELLTATKGPLYADGDWRREAAREEGRHLAHLPRSIQDAVHQRTERLSAPASHALILAAVAGQRFDFALLQQVLQCDEARLLALMKELMAAQLVVEEAEDQFAFRHALIREAVYAELLARERRSLHRAIAEALESLSATPAMREAGVTSLAYHFSEAGIWPKALEYQQRAGEKALSLYAPRAATDHLTRALDAAQRLQVTPAARLYFARGQAYATLGDFEHARDDYEHAAAIARTEHNGVLEWQCMLALGFLWAGRDYAQAGEWFQRASSLAEHLADSSLRARSLNRLGNWLANTGHVEEGLHAHQEALQLFEGMQDVQGMAETFDLLGAAFAIAGDQVNAVRHLGQAIALFRMLDDRQSLMSSLAMRAIQSPPTASITSVCAMRSLDECLHDAAEALRLARQIESPSGQAFAEMAMSRALASFGEFGPALIHTREISRAASAIEHHQWLVASAMSSGAIYLLLLAPAEARATWEAGLAMARQLGSTNWIVLLAANIALACIAQHDLSAAEAALSAVLPRDQLPRNNAERFVTLSWGELALAQGAPEIALQLAEHLLASAPGTRVGEPPQLIPHLLKLKGEALMALARLEEAVEALEGAKRGALIRQERPVLWTIHRSLGRLYRLLKREEEVRKEVAAARRLIEDLAATLDDAPLREQFVGAALNSLPQVKPLSTREVTKRAFGGLTARERQVAALVAQGKTSREIAARLVVSERTAEVHVSNILGKLGFTSRAQIAVWAVENGLTSQ